MRETEFKTLMYCGEYVNANLLESGVYTCITPFLYSKKETIESLIEKGREIQDMTGVYVSEKYFDSLKQCQLVPVTVEIQETKRRKNEHKTSN